MRAAALMWEMPEETGLEEVLEVSSLERFLASLTKTHRSTLRTTVNPWRLGLGQPQCHQETADGPAGLHLERDRLGFWT